MIDGDWPNRSKLMPGMVFYELSEGHREAVTGKLKTDIEQLRDEFTKANIEQPDDIVEFFELLRDAK